MLFLFPILAALLQASSSTLDKFILTIRGVSYRIYTALSFPLIFCVHLVLFLIIRPPFGRELFTTNTIIAFAGLIAAGIAINIVYYRALKTDRLTELEPLSLLDRIALIIVTGVLFADERKLALIIPALIASLAVLWSHWERHHIRIHKESLLFLAVGLVTAPLGAAAVKILLTSWHPVTLRFLESMVMAIIMGILYQRSLSHTPAQAASLLIITNVLTSLAWLFVLFSYQTLGIVHTILIFSLQPLLVYFASLVFLREPFQTKKFAAFLVVLGSIIAAQIFQ